MSILDDGKDPAQLEREETTRRMNEAAQEHLNWLMSQGQASGSYVIAGEIDGKRRRRLPFTVATL